MTCRRWSTYEPDGTGLGSSLLFGDDHAVQARLRAALTERPAGEAPAAAVLEAVVGLAALGAGQREQGRARRAVIEAAPALQARQRVKLAAYEVVLLDGLIARGLDVPQARLLARAAVACADEALIRWLSDDDAERPGLEGRLRATYRELTHLLQA